MITEPSAGFFRGKRIVITGASGLLGVSLVERLRSYGAHVRAVVHSRPLDLSSRDLEIMTADLTRQEDCDRAMAGMDMACLCASVTVGAAEAVKNPLGAVTDNLVMSARSLQSVATTRIERVLLVSSTTVYPAYGHPVREDEAFLEEPHPAYQGVGNMKRYIEKLARFYHDKYGLAVAIVRPVPFFGAHDNFDFATCHVIPSLIRKAVEHQTPYEVWGSGSEVRDFLHVSDVARGCLLALERCADSEAVNLGSGKSVTIAELAGMILANAGHETPLVFNASQPSTIPLRIVNVDRAREKLDFSPAITLEEGLAGTIEWFRTHREEILRRISDRENRAS